jgi:hypothetical protein
MVVQLYHRLIEPRGANLATGVQDIGEGRGFGEQSEETVVVRPRIKTKPVARGKKKTATNKAHQPSPVEEPGPPGGSTTQEGPAVPSNSRTAGRLPLGHVYGVSGGEHPFHRVRDVFLTVTGSNAPTVPRILEEYAVERGLEFQQEMIILRLKKENDTLREQRDDALARVTLLEEAADERRIANQLLPQSEVDVHRNVQTEESEVVSGVPHTELRRVWQETTERLRRVKGLEGVDVERDGSSNDWSSEFHIVMFREDGGFNVL